MGSSNADKKYGGEKNPIKLSGSFYETPTDRNKNTMSYDDGIGKKFNNVNVSSFENVIRPHQASQFI